MLFLRPESSRLLQIGYVVHGSHWTSLDSHYDHAEQTSTHDGGKSDWHLPRGEMFTAKLSHIEKPHVSCDGP